MTLVKERHTNTRHTYSRRLIAFIKWQKRKVSERERERERDTITYTYIHPCERETQKYTHTYKNPKP